MQIVPSSARVAACLLLVALLPACPARVLPTWFTHIGGDADDGAHAVIPVRGGFVVAGFTEAEAAADDNALLMKVGPGGRVLWRAEFGDDREDQALAVAEAPDGGYAVAGQFGSHLDPTSDGFLIKTDRNGREQWRRLIDSGGHDAAVSVAARAGGYLVGAQLDLFNETRAVAMATASDGIPLWEVSAGPNTHAAKAIVTADGGCAMAYWTLEPGEEPMSFTSTVGVFKTDAAGAEAWRKVHTADVACEVRDLRQTPDGGYILAGQYDVMHQDSRVLLWKLDADGDIEWKQAFGRGLRDAAYAVRPTRDGGYIVAGAIQPDRRHSDMFLAKTDAYGNVRWERAYGGDDLDVAYDVIELDRGYAFVGLGESFEEEGDHDHKQIVIARTDAQGHTRTGEVPLPEPPEVKPEHYELISFQAGSHTLTPDPEDPERFQVVLENVAETTTTHRVLPAPEVPLVRNPDGTPWGAKAFTPGMHNLDHDAVRPSGTLWPVAQLPSVWSHLGYEADPPEAGLLVGYSGTDPHLMHLRLSNPRYDGETNRLIFDGRSVHRLTSPGLIRVDEGRIVEPAKSFDTYLFVAPPPAPRAVTDADYAAEVLQSEVPTIVFFWAEWCGPCRLVSPSYEELCSEVSGVKFCKLDVDINPQTAYANQVRSLPTFVIYRDGQAVDRLVGAVPKSALYKFIERNL